jgi:hypothetical protein
VGIAYLMIMEINRMKNVSHFSKGFFEQDKKIGDEN